MSSEDRIRFLCTKLLEADDPHEIRIVAKELQTAIHEHIERVRRALSSPTLQTHAAPSLLPLSALWDTAS